MEQRLPVTPLIAGIRTRRTRGVALDGTTNSSEQPVGVPHAGLPQEFSKDIEWRMETDFGE